MALPEATARLNAVADAGDQQALSNALRECVPLVVAQLEKDGSREALLNLWGTSSNADASSPDTPTVHPLLLSELGKLAGKEMGGEVVHAGLMHTYGYLLSNLKTPFGFKRARYTQPTVELGLGLPKGLLSPRPNNGTLLANLTYVAGGFGLGKSGPGFAGEIGAAGELADTTIKAGERFRLTERILEADGVALLEPFEIRTELVEFGGKKGKDSHWLVYSV